MNKIFSILLVIGLVLAFQACEDHPALDTQPKDSFSEAPIYADINLTEKLVFQTYNALEGWMMLGGDWWTRRSGIENCSDECMFHWKDVRFSVLAFAYPDQVSAAAPGLAVAGTWSAYYKHVRNATVFLSKIEDSEVMNSEDETVAARARHLKGEMLYLRARSYFLLTNYYGGVPYMDEIINLGEDYNIARTPYEECITNIVADLSEAVEILPGANDATYRNDANFGRITKEAAAALKSRVLLYAASDLHDPSTSPSGPNFDYTVSTKWQDAADAAKEAIELAEAAGFYMPQTGDDWREYQELFTRKSAGLILGRMYYTPHGTTAQEVGAFGGGIQTLPDYAHGMSGDGFWMTSQPTHNHAMSYRKTDGTLLAMKETEVDPNTLYQDRDPRFYANLVTNGAIIRGREAEMWVPNGYDSKDRDGVLGLHASKTGYGLRKFMDESLSIEDALESGADQRPYPLARLAELYLNYAEALYRTGNEGAAKQELNKITSRVNMPDHNVSGADLMEAIKEERFKELFFEGHRFFDLRRWMDTEKLAEDIYGVEWSKMKDGELDADGELQGEMLVVDPKTWDDKIYYLPIPLTETEKVETLEQNPGY